MWSSPLLPLSLLDSTHTENIQTSSHAKVFLSKMFTLASFFSEPIVNYLVDKYIGTLEILLTLEKFQHQNLKILPVLNSIFLLKVSTDCLVPVMVFL